MMVLLMSNNLSISGVYIDPYNNVRVDSANGSNIILTNVKENPLGKSEWAKLQLAKNCVKYSYPASIKIDARQKQTFLVKENITNKETLKKLLSFFQKQNFELLNISECQKVTKEAFENSKNLFVTNLRKLL